MIRKCHFIILGISAAQVFGAAPANASAATDIQASDRAWTSKMNFDLLRDCPRDLAGPASADDAVPYIAARPEGAQAEGNDYSAKEQLGPEWSYQPLASGPVLQFAALGAGKKKRPGLAHVALDWNF